MTNVAKRDWNYPSVIEVILHGDLYSPIVLKLLEGTNPDLLSSYGPLELICAIYGVVWPCAGVKFAHGRLTPYRPRNPHGHPEYIYRLLEPRSLRGSRYPAEFRRMRGFVCLMYGYDDSTPVHHIDQDRSNNALWNLIPMSSSEHCYITARHDDPYLNALDMAVFYSITEYWTA